MKELQIFPKRSYEFSAQSTFWRRCKRKINKKKITLKKRLYYLCDKYAPAPKTIFTNYYMLQVVLHI